MRDLQTVCFRAAQVRAGRLGVQLNREGKALFNWPLHTMINHVPEMMQYVWNEGEIPFGLTCLKVSLVCVCQFFFVWSQTGFITLCERLCAVAGDREVQRSFENASSADSAHGGAC